MPCENQSLLIMLALSSLHSQFMLLLYYVLKVGKEKSMHSSPA